MVKLEEGETEETMPSPLTNALSVLHMVTGLVTVQMRPKETKIAASRVLRLVTWPVTAPMTPLLNALNVFVIIVVMTEIPVIVIVIVTIVIVIVTTAIETATTEEMTILAVHDQDQDRVLLQDTTGIIIATEVQEDIDVFLFLVFIVLY